MTTTESVNSLDELLKRASVKFKLLDYDSMVKGTLIKAVTTGAIFEPNSKQFHPDGLFSESIFGAVTDMKRFTTFGFIQLHTNIIHPVIYSEVVAPRKLYTGILSGKRFAKWSNEENDFVVSSENDKKAGTGYTFFLSHMSKLANRTSKSLKNNNKFLLLKKYKKSLTTNKFLVLPAGLRDIKVNTARLSQDDINKIYIQLIALSTGLSDHSLSNDMVFDDIRSRIQGKVHEVYKAIFTIMNGKHGFMSGHYGKRKVAMSTRNVASVSLIKGTDPDDPLVVRSNEVAVPLLNTLKAFQPMFIKAIKTDLYGESITNEGAENIQLTDLTTLNTVYVTVKPSEVRKYTDSKELGRLINNFKDVGFRRSSVTIRGADNKMYALLLIYIDGTDIYIGKNKEELIKNVETSGKTINVKKIRPLSWAEAIYISAIRIVSGKYAVIARYPITGEESIFTAKVVPVTTTHSINGILHYNDGRSMKVLRFPRIDDDFVESISISSSRLRGLGAD